MSRTASWAAMGLVIILAASAAHGQASISLTVTGGKADLANVPVSAAISLPADLANLPAEQVRVDMKGPGGAATSGQVIPDGGKATLWWIVPAIKAGEKQTWTAALAKGVVSGEAFAWKDDPGKQLDLLWAGKPVIRYMYGRDKSTKETDHNTYKVYTHVMNEEGTAPITKGPGGLYTHHRGVFIGWNRTGYDGTKRNDWWHMSGVTMEHQKVLSRTAGPVLARLVTLIHWLDGAGKPVVIEEREQTAFRQPALTMLLLDFRSRLTAARSDVELNGDPEHAGFHYRPANEVDKKATKYQFPKAETTTANVKNELDMPWAGEGYVLGSKAYSVQIMSAPDNPKGTKWSAYRDYGRFGAFFVHTIKQGQTLPVYYRVWVASGAMAPREQMQAAWEAFADPPTAAPQP